MKTIKNKVLLFALLASGCNLRGSDSSFSLHEPMLDFDTGMTIGEFNPNPNVRNNDLKRFREMIRNDMDRKYALLQAQIDEFRDSQERLMESFLRTQALVLESFGPAEASVGAAEDSERIE